MLKFSPCLERMFTKEYPDFYDRFKAAKTRGLIMWIFGSGPAGI